MSNEPVENAVHAVFRKEEQQAQDTLVTPMPHAHTHTHVVHTSILLHKSADFNTTLGYIHTINATSANCSRRNLLILVQVEAAS